MVRDADRVTFQAELSTKKVIQGSLFTDPRAGVRRFGDIRREYVANVLRMIQGTLDLAVCRHVIPGHHVVGIDLKTYPHTAEEWAAKNAPWVCVADEQVRQLADGITVARRAGITEQPAP